MSIAADTKFGIRPYILTAPPPASRNRTFIETFIKSMLAKPRQFLYRSQTKLVALIFAEGLLHLLSQRLRSDPVTLFLSITLNKADDSAS